MHTKTSEELNVMLRSYENAKNLASILYVLIQIARREGLLALEDYNIPKEISKESCDVLEMMIKFIVQGCIRNTTDLRGTLNTLMGFHMIRTEVERKVLMTGIMAIQEGESPYLVKKECEKTLTKAKKSIEYAMKRFLKTEVVENETLMNRWQPPAKEEPDSTDMGEDVVLSQEEIDELLKSVEPEEEDITPETQ